MTAIHWAPSPEGSNYWNPLFANAVWKNSTEDKQLTEFLVEKYPAPECRSKQSQKNYRHALKLIATYEERFGNLPSVELLEALL